MKKLPLSIEKLGLIIEAACKDGFFYDGYLYEYEPEVSRKLLSDRKLLIEVAERILRLKKNRPDSPTILLLNDVLEKVKAGWPRDEGR